MLWKGPLLHRKVYYFGAFKYENLHVTDIHHLQQESENTKQIRDIRAVTYIVYGNYGDRRVLGKCTLLGAMYHSLEISGRRCFLGRKHSTKSNITIFKSSTWFQDCKADWLMQACRATETPWVCHVRAGIWESTNQNFESSGWVPLNISFCYYDQATIQASYSTTSVNHKAYHVESSYWCT